MENARRGRRPLAPLPPFDRRRRRVAAQRRRGRDRRRERRHGMGRQPEPRRGRGAALLSERRRAGRSARVRVPHGEPRAGRGGVRGGGGGRRSRVRGAGRGRRGRRGREADDRAARRTGARARRRAPRPELHGFLRTGRAGRLERAPRETRRRRVMSPCSASRDRSPTRSSPSAGGSGCVVSSRPAPRR